MAIAESLIELIEADLGAPRRKHGKWLFWNCPFHLDKNPSLGVDTADPHWFCFGCKRGGREKEWRTQYRKETSPARFRVSPLRRPVPAPPDNNHPPSEIWQIRAQTWIATWKDVLWTPQGKPGRWYLYGRGLNGEVIKSFALGYNPHDRFEKLDDWGLEPRSPEEKCVFLPAGVCIPWIVDGQVWKLNFRRFDRLPKYLQVKGSRPGLFGANRLRDHAVAMMVEGEFDALLLEQEAGDLVGVCTLGSASSRAVDGRWLSYLMHCHKIILVGDGDAAGLNWVHSMGGISRRFCCASVPVGKDITEFWLKGGDLRQWVQALLEQIQVIGVLVPGEPQALLG